MDRINSSTQWAAALTAGILATMVWLPQARGELVYEDETQAETLRADDRGTLRDALGSAERARVSRQARAEDSRSSYDAVEPAAEAAPVVRTARMGDSAEDLRNMNKSELMRRERVREELRNEDALQERLEELRLRDERRRTKQLLGSGSSEDAAGTAAVGMPSAVYGSGIQEEKIAAPVTERPGQPAPAPASVSGATTPTGVQMAGVSSVMAYDQAGGAQSAVSTSLELEAEEKTSISVMPRAGLGGMESKGGYDINPRFAAGVGIGIASSDNLSFEVGYTYSEYGVSIGSANPFVQSMQNWQRMSGYQGNFETLAMKQNVVDAGLKIHLLGSRSKIRPFIGGGAAYSKSYINYDQKILDLVNRDPSLRGFGTDYELSSYLGYLSGGLDVKMSKSVAVGVLFKYYAVLSSRESGNLNNYGFYNPYATGFQPDPEKQYVGGSVAKAAFYSIMGGVTFTF